MSLTVGQKAHRRTTSINTISISSTENIFTATPIHAVDNNNTRQQNILPDSLKNPNLTFTIIKEKNDQFPIKKQQQKPSFFSRKSPRLDIKKILLFFIFLWAFVVFMLNLCGIGPVDEELLKNFDQNPVVNETRIDDNEDIDTLEEIPQNTFLPLNNNQFDINTSNDKENIIDNASSISEKTIPTYDDDDIVDVKDKLEYLDSSIDSTQIKISNKLGKKKQKIEIIGTLNEDNVVIDYSNYTYFIVKPHFTHIDVIESLSTEEYDNYVALQILQKNGDDDNSCGSWQDKYTKLHEEILNGSAPQRYIGYICDDKINCGSLADR
jgi:hypothetical protein